MGHLCILGILCLDVRADGKVGHKLSFPMGNLLNRLSTFLVNEIYSDIACNCYRYCMCHPQYSKSCGISSVVSCWNYLFSVLGNGRYWP